MHIYYLNEQLHIYSLCKCTCTNIYLSIFIIIMNNFLCIFINALIKLYSFSNWAARSYRKAFRVSTVQICSKFFLRRSRCWHNGNFLDDRDQMSCMPLSYKSSWKHHLKFYKLQHQSRVSSISNKENTSQNSRSPLHEKSVSIIVKI